MLLAIDGGEKEILKEEASRFTENLCREYSGTDDGITVTVEKTGEGAGTGASSGQPAENRLFPDESSERGTEDERPDPGTGGNIPEPRYSEIRAGITCMRVRVCGAPWEVQRKPFPTSWSI